MQSQGKIVVLCSFLAITLTAVTPSFATTTKKPAPVAGTTHHPRPTPVQSSPAPSSGSVETCFSPNGGCDQKLIGLINSATNTLDVAIYAITHTGIAQAISAAKNRGVQVRVVADRVESKGNSSQVATLVSEGVALKIGNFKGIMHNKYTIVDGQHLETGSFNYTQNATLDNAENQLYIDDAGVIAQYQANFDQIYGNALNP